MLLRNRVITRIIRFKKDFLLKSWLCDRCGKQEETRFFSPSWAENYSHYIHHEDIRDPNNPWDYGSKSYCGHVIMTKKRKFEEV